MKAKKSPSSASADGHRQRLRDRFLKADGFDFDDRRTLELLLTYAIPRRDVLPLADALLARFGSIDAVLKASPEELFTVAGVGDASVLLIKVVERLASASASTPSPKRRGPAGIGIETGLFQPMPTVQPPQDRASASKTQPAPPEAMSPKPVATEPQRAMRPARGPRRIRSGLFGKGLLKDAIECLPKLPDTDSLDEIRTFLKNGGLHYSGEKTRQRFSSYVVARLFPGDVADRALPLFARRFMGHTAARDVAFYRFIKAEPLLQEILLALVVPAAGGGTLQRERLRQFVASRFPSAKPNATKSCAQAAAEIFQAGGIGSVSRTRITVSFRDIVPESFAFILHSEFPEPGMYDLRKVEQGNVFRAMLWRPDAILPAMYELRNRGWISKISEIDTVRQFTTRFTLDQVVERIVCDGGGR